MKKIVVIGATGTLGQAVSAELKARHREIPWAKVAGIGNVLRHDYERIAPDVIWKLATIDLPILDATCRDELARS